MSKTITTHPIIPDELPSGWKWTPRGAAKRLSLRGGVWVIITDDGEVEARGRIPVPVMAAVLARFVGKVGA